MVGSYTPPGVVVVQQPNAAAAPTPTPLLAHVAGGHAFLLRYGIAAEKAQAALGAYDPLNPHTYPWPGLPAGALLDPGYTALYVDGARLEYFADAVGSGDVVAPVAGSANRVRIADATYGFRANPASGNPRLPALGDRDVQPGDRVLVRGVVAGAAYSLDTYVLALAADPTASSVAAPVAGASNGGTQSRTAVVTQTAGAVGNTLAASVASYNSYADGPLSETYTVAVVAGSIDGDLETATLRVTSASGLDDALAVTPGMLNQWFSVGHRGLQLRFTLAGDSGSLSLDDLVVGQAWTVAVVDAYTQVQAASGGTYTGAADATYVATVTRGGLFAGALPPQVTVTTADGSDGAAAVTVTALGQAIALGTLGATLTLSASGATGLRRGDTFVVAATASRPGRYGTLVLARNLPTPLQSASDLELRLSLVKDLVVPAESAAGVANWTQSQAGLVVEAALEAGDPSLTSGGAAMTVPVVAGSLFVQYRAWRQEQVGQLATVATVSELATALPGPIHPDNPLTYGAYCALQNSAGQPVLATAVADPGDVTAWEAVLARLVGRVEAYNLAPITRDPTVIGLYHAHVTAMAGPAYQCFRGLFTSLAGAPWAARATAATSTDGHPILATIAQDPDAAAGTYTLVQVPAGNADFLTGGVRPGDVLRAGFATAAGVTAYQSYTVAAVDSEDQLRLTAGPAQPVAAAARVEVWHPNTRDEEAAAIAAAASAFADRRVCATWPDTLGSGGTAVDGTFLACALAGLASGVPPHQGLTNYPVQGFDDLSRTTAYFNADQLNTLAAGGAWIVTRDPGGVVKTRHALTTDTTSVTTREEMVRRNVDSCSFYFIATAAPFIGVTNAVPSALQRLNTELLAAISYLKTAHYTTTLGGQLGGNTQLLSVARDAVLADHVVVQMALDVPVADDTITIYLNF